MKNFLTYFKMKNYCIIKGYQPNDAHEIKSIDASKRSDKHQIKIYELAKQIAEINSLNKIADVGCGTGFKLKKYFNKNDIIGYDITSNVMWLIKKYPNNLWIVSDFNSTPAIADLVICADVIEHVNNPDELINFIIKMNPKHVIISTPDRDQLRDKYDRPYLGPPKNKHHFREWSFSEFDDYISVYFDIIQHNKIEKECSQFIHCKIKT